MSAVMALMLLSPAEMDAQRNTGLSRSERRAQRQSVTEATSEAAKKASRKGGLSKITVSKPDLEKIRIESLDPADKHYFPKMMKKYLAKDTTMTPEEFRYLYLGYMFQEDYDPYRDSPYNVRLDTIGDIAGMSKAEMKNLSDRIEKALQDNPFDLRQMSMLVQLLRSEKKSMKAKIWEFRLENLLGAIKSTGTGEDPDNAWFVIYPMHEYDMVQLLGYNAVDIDYDSPGIDHLLVEPDGTVNHRKPAQGFYFNVAVPQQQYELKHPGED